MLFRSSNLPSEDARLVLHEQRGLPFPAFSCEVRLGTKSGFIQAATNPSQEKKMPITNGIAISPVTESNFKSGSYRLLPLRPQIGILIIDSALWGALFFVLYSLYCSIVHKWRVRQGRCIKCGYDLRESDRKSVG